MDNTPSSLQQQAHDNAVEAGTKLAEAEKTLKEAKELMQEASIRFSNARKFEEILKERQRKLDRGFVLLNRQKRTFQAQQLRDNDRRSLIDDNIKNY